MIDPQACPACDGAGLICRVCENTGEVTHLRARSYALCMAAVARLRATGRDVVTTRHRLGLSAREWDGLHAGTLPLLVAERVEWEVAQ